MFLNAVMANIISLERGNGHGLAALAESGFTLLPMNGFILNKVIDTGGRPRWRKPN
jgi:hypothetical protein